MNQVTCSALSGRDRHHTTSIEPPPRLLTSGKEGLPVVRRAGWHCPDLALLSPPPAEIVGLSVERGPVVRLPLVIAHPQLQRHGALNRVSANDETKRVSARVVKHPRNRRETVALACRPGALRRSGWQTGRAWPFGRAPLEALSSARRAGEPAEAMGGASTLVRRWSRPGRDASRGERRAIRCEPVPPGPEALFTFGRGPAVTFRRRLAAELTSSLPKLARRSVSMDASAVCLHNQNACTNHTVTHSAGQ